MPRRNAEKGILNYIENWNGPVNPNNNEDTLADEDLLQLLIDADFTGVGNNETIDLNELAEKVKLNEIDEDGLERLKNDLTLSQTLELIKLVHFELEPWEICELAQKLEPAQKLEVIELVKDRLYISDIRELMQDMNSDEILKVIGLTEKSLGSGGILRITLDLMLDKLEVIKLVGARMESKDIARLTFGMNSAEKLEVIKLKEVKLSEFDRFELIKTMGEEYKKACIEGKIEGVELDEEYKLGLIKIMEEEYKKACIEGRVEGVELDDDFKLGLIKSMEEEYKKECIGGKIHLTNDEILLIIETIKDEDYILSYINNPQSPIDDNTMQKIKCLRLIRHVNDINVEPKLNFSLPEEMTIGMEIENEGELSDYIEKNLSFGGWKAKGDHSLINGVEIVSPILHPVLEDLRDIYKVTEILNRVGQNVSERCGGHIHIGADYLTSVQAYKNLMEIWGNTEKILYTISNEKGTAPRTGMADYASPINAKLQDAIKSGKIELTDETELDEFVEGLQFIQGDRYSGLNLLNINNGKNTIEFRLANGTINPDLWLDNINLFGGIVAVAQELTVTQDKRKQELFERLTEDISDEEKLPILLELVGVDPERYVERYRVNRELMKESEHAFSGVKGPTKFVGKNIKEMTKNVPALSQLYAMQSIVKEMEHQQEQQKDNAKGI